MIVYHNYGPLKKGRRYKAIGEGFDYTLLRYGGRGLYVPSWVFVPDKADKSIQEFEEDFQYYLEQEDV